MKRYVIYVVLTMFFTTTFLSCRDRQKSELTPEQKIIRDMKQEGADVKVKEDGDESKIKLETDDKKVKLKREDGESKVKIKTDSDDN